VKNHCGGSLSNTGGCTCTPTSWTATAYRLDVKDACEEAGDVWRFVYQELQDTVLFTTASSEEDESESDEED
jgi:hypothetical protein